jgi:histidinol-phosphate aminotransferase
VNRDAYIARLIPQWVRDGAAYQVADASGMVKLDAMENPYVWPVELRAALAERLVDCELNRYPDPHASGVRDPLRAWMHIPSSLGMLFGNGSDEIIALLTSTLIESGRSVCAPDPSFVMFQVLAKQHRVPFHALPLDVTRDIDLDAWLATLRTANPGILFVPQPNNPTGNLFSKDRLIQVIEATDALVVIDEAYTAFTDADYVDWAIRYPNVVIMRTLSKVGLAGSRFGLLIGDPAWVDQLDKLRLPYNINALSQAAVQFALEHAEVLERQSAAIRDERARLHAALQARNLTVWPSEANFLIALIPDGRAREVFEGLKRHGVLVKCLDGSHPMMANALRVTVGAPHESDALLSALDQLLGGGR